MVPRRWGAVPRRVAARAFPTGRRPVAPHIHQRGVTGVSERAWPGRSEFECTVEANSRAPRPTLILRDYRALGSGAHEQEKAARTRADRHDVRRHINGGVHARSSSAAPGNCLRPEVSVPRWPARHPSVPMPMPTPRRGGVDDRDGTGVVAVCDSVGPHDPATGAVGVKPAWCVTHDPRAANRAPARCACWSNRLLLGAREQGARHRVATTPNHGRPMGPPKTLSSTPCVGSRPRCCRSCAFRRVAEDHSQYSPDCKTSR